MAPLGAWVPWAEVVQIASGHGFTLETCFHCAEHWLTLGALEMDPMWRPGKVMDPTEVVRIRFLYHRDIHGDQGLVCVSSEEEDLDHGKGEVQLEHAAAICPRRWKTGVLDRVRWFETPRRCGKLTPGATRSKQIQLSTEEQWRCVPSSIHKRRVAGFGKKEDSFRVIAEQ